MMTRFNIMFQYQVSVRAVQWHVSMAHFNIMFQWHISISSFNIMFHEGQPNSYVMNAGHCSSFLLCIRGWSQFHFKSICCMAMVADSPSNFLYSLPFFFPLKMFIDEDSPQSLFCTLISYVSIVKHPLGSLQWQGISYN